MSHRLLAVFVIHEGFSLFGYGIARDLIRMAHDTGSVMQVEALTVAAVPGLVQSSCGAQILADHDWSVIPRADYVFVCSSRDIHPAAVSASLLKKLRSCHRHGGWVIGLGSSIFTLGQAGLLADRRATAHPAQLAALQSAFPATDFTVRPFVIDQRVVTCVGGDAVTDLMLDLLSRTFDPAIAETVRRYVLLKPERSEAFIASIGLRGSIENLDPRLVRYIQVIEQTLSDPRPLPEVCAAIAVSPRTLSRLTQAAFACAPGALSARIRLDHAAGLLRSTPRELSDISDASGYSSAAHFSDAFHKRFRTRPGRYRATRNAVPAQEN
jgi:transcriptional regulator GlxA family with amidase domain